MVKDHSDDPAFEKALNDYLKVTHQKEKTEYSAETEPFKAYAQKFRVKLKEELFQFQKAYASGYRLLLGELLKETPNLDLTSFKPNIENLKLLDDPQAFLEFVAEGKTISDLLGFTPEVMLTFYEVANRLVEAARFQEGVDAFFFLATISPDTSEYWLDLGYCHSQLGQYQAAVDAYFRAIDIDPNSFDSYLSCATTYVKMQDFDSAKRVLDIGLEHAIAHRGEVWAETLGTMLEEAKEHIQVLQTKSQHGTFTG